MTPLKESMYARLDRTLVRVQKRISKAKRLIDADRIGGEAGRIWLDQYAKGKGLDVCSGDFLIGDADGVDGDRKCLGALDFRLEGAGNLTSISSEEMDFVVTNYIEVFSDLIGALNEWHRVLKPGGILAFVCSNADARETNPLGNRKKQTLLTPKLARFYLDRTGFKVIDLECVDAELRVMAKKVKA